MRIIIRNLPKSYNENILLQELNKYKEVTDVYLLRNNNKESKRICFVGYKNKEDAESAVLYYNNSYFRSHKITAELAREEENTEISDDFIRQIEYSKILYIKNIPDLDFTEEIIKFGSVEYIKRDNLKNIIVKFNEGKSAVNFYKNMKVLGGKRIKISLFTTPKKKEENHLNFLFFSFETVTKKHKLNIKNNQIGSEVSLMETKLVNETKDFLIENNIEFSAPKSKNILILRNSDLIGALDLVEGDYKLKMAPSKTLALLIFKDQSLAYKNYKKLNLRTYKNKIIYCEYAPVGTLKNKEIEETPKLIIKNIPFQANELEIKAIFNSFAKIKEIRIPKKPDGSHKGYCFIVFDSNEKATAAMENFGVSTHLYGRRLVIEKAKN